MTLSKWDESDDPFRPLGGRSALHEWQTSTTSERHWLVPRLFVWGRVRAGCHFRTARRFTHQRPDERGKPSQHVMLTIEILLLFDELNRQTLFFCPHGKAAVISLSRLVGATTHTSCCQCSPLSSRRLCPRCRRLIWRDLGKSHCPYLPYATNRIPPLRPDVSRSLLPSHPRTCTSARMARGKRTATAKKRRSKWNSENILSNSKSPLASCDLRVRAHPISLAQRKKKSLIRSGAEVLLTFADGALPPPCLVVSHS